MKLEELVSLLLTAGEADLAHALTQLQPTNQLHALMLSAAIDAIERDGLVGVEWIKRQLFGVLNGQGDLDLTDLRLASDLLAAMQGLEADERTAARNLITRLADAIGPVVAALLGIAARG